MLALVGYQAIAVYSFDILVAHVKLLVLGNIFGQLPEATSTQSKQGTTEASPASRPPAVLPPTTE